MERAYGYRLKVLNRYYSHDHFVAQADSVRGSLLRLAMVTFRDEMDLTMRFDDLRATGKGIVSIRGHDEGMVYALIERGVEVTRCPVESWTQVVSPEDMDI